jgi:hypothetical protein
MRRWRRRGSACSGCSSHPSPWRGGKSGGAAKGGGQILRGWLNLPPSLGRWRGLSLPARGRDGVGAARTNPKLLLSKLNVQERELRRRSYGITGTRYQLLKSRLFECAVGGDTVRGVPDVRGCAFDVEMRCVILCALEIGFERNIPITHRHEPGHLRWATHDCRNAHPCQRHRGNARQRGDRRGHSG